MKTPKRQVEEWESYLLKARFRMNENRIKYARWKRKNRIAQYKRTIARLTAERRKFRKFRRGEYLNDSSFEWEAFMILCGLKTPAEDAASSEKFEYFITLRKVGELALNAACLAAKAYGKAVEKENAACHPAPPENEKQ